MNNPYMNSAKYPTLHIGCTINSITDECVDHDSGMVIPSMCPTHCIPRDIFHNLMYGDHA